MGHDFYCVPMPIVVLYCLFGLSERGIADNILPIEVFHVNSLSKADTNPNSTNLSIGAYQTGDGLPWVLPVVRKAICRLASDDLLDHAYLEIHGYEPFCRVAVELLLGKDNLILKEGKAFGIQTIAGTGGLRLGAEFLASILGYKTVVVSEPTWLNHHGIFEAAGFLNIKSYRYWCPRRKCLDFDENAVVVLHACAHNPTGCDPSKKQWEDIAQIIMERRLFPFFDCAYQGLASGDPDEDAFPVRHFVAQGIELFCAQSFSKNFGLYSERVGNLTVVTSDSDSISPIKSHMSLFIRRAYSNPPAYGCKIVNMVLSNPEMRKQWLEHLRTMTNRIKQTRLEFGKALENKRVPGNWSHITEQTGMFSYTGLTGVQCEELTTKHHIYLPKSGRINMCGITSKNLDHVVNSFHIVCSNKTK